MIFLGEAIGDSIRTTFMTRFREIMDASQNASEVNYSHNSIQKSWGQATY